MKRFAVLALAAVFAFSFTASVAAAPEFSGSFTVDNELDLGADAIDVAGDGPDLTFSLGAAEEGIWSLTVDLGSALTDGATIGVLGSFYGGFLADADGAAAYLTEEVEVETATYYKDIDGNYYNSSGAELSDADAAKLDRQIAAGLGEWSDISMDYTADVVAPGLELGAYELSVTPGPFTLVVAGNGAAPATTDLFEFIGSDDEPDDPKFQLTSDIAGVGLTTEYQTEGDDALYVFAKTPVAGIGTFGVAFEAADLALEEPGMQFSADVSSDALGFATLKGGVAFDMGAEDGNDSLAFAIGAEATVIEGLKVDASYTNEGRDVASTAHTQTISGGLDYGDGMVTASVSSETAGETDEAAKLTLNAGVTYPVIPDVFTVTGSFESIADEGAAIGDPGDYEWDGVDVGDILFGLMTVDASATYAVTDALSVTPSLSLQSYTFGVGAGADRFAVGEEEVTGSITTLGVSGTYAFSDSASFTLGFENAAGEAVETEDGTVLPEVKSTTISTGFSVSF